MITISPSVEGSGETLKLEFLDSSGNPTNLCSIGSTNDVQTITLNGALTGNQFTLGFNGQTTAEIPVIQQIPSRFALFTVPVTPGTAYTVAADVGTGGNYPEIRVDVIDGITGSNLGPILATQTLDQATPTYDNVVHADGLSPSYMKTVGTVTPSTSSLLILYSTTAAVTAASYNASITLVSVTNVATSTPTYYGVHDSQFTYAANNSLLLNVGTGPYGVYNGYVLAIRPAYGAPSGTPPLSVGGPASNVSASSIQSALLALSSVASGGLAVTDQSGSGVGPYTVTFQGPMAGVDEPLITSNSSSITVAHTRLGGQFPTYSINGGSPISFSRQIYWGDGNFGPGDIVNTLTAPYLPAVWLFLPQSPPAVSYFPFGAWPVKLGDYSWSYDSGIGYSGVTTVSSNPGATATVYLDLEGIQDGSYQISMTWPTSLSGLSSAVSVLISDSQGNALETVSVNQSVAPSGVSDSGYNWTILGSFTIAYPAVGFNITVTVPASGSAAIDAFRIARTSAIISKTIQPSDVVTVSVPTGLFTTASGAVPAQTVTATNYSGSTSLPAVTNTAKTMGVGYNITSDNVIQPALMYSNQAARLDFSGSSGVVLDSLGNPVSATASSVGSGVLVTPGMYQFASLAGLAAAPNGLWTFEWDGASVGTLTNIGATTQTEETTYQNLTGTTNNRRVYNFQAQSGLLSAPTMGVTFQASGAAAAGHYPFNISNIRIYPPDPSDPTGMTPWLTGRTYWYPAFLRYLQNAQSLRFMDFLGINQNNVGNYADFRVSGSLASPTRLVNAGIVSITNPTTPYFYPGRAVSIEITLDTAVDIPNPCVPVLTITQEITFSTGQTMAPGDYYGGLCKVISPTVIQMSLYFIGAPATMTGTTSGGTISLAIAQNSGILTDVFSLCNAVNTANCWLNIPLSATDACVTSMAQAALALNPGINLCVEFSNEIWNYGFFAGAWLDHVAYHLTGTFGFGHELGNVYRSQQVHNLVLAVWNAAGRGASVKRVMASQGADSSVTGNIVSAAKTYNAQFEYLATATYVDAHQISPGNSPELSFTQLSDQLTAGQSSDFFDRVIEYSGLYEGEVTAHQTILTAGGYSGVQVVNYEGGFEFVVANQSSVAGYKRSYEVIFAPRIYAAMGRYLQKLQDAGLALLNIYYVFGNGFTNDIGQPVQNGYPAVWPTYIGYNQAVGTGNPAIDTVNATTPTALATVKSEVGGAVNYWNSLLPGRIVPPPHYISSPPADEGHRYECSRR